MFMSLTISQPTKTEFGSRFFTTHEFHPRVSLAKPSLSPRSRVDSHSPSPVGVLRAGTLASEDRKAGAIGTGTGTSSMSSPRSMRGLPPPSAMALPDPRRDVGSTSFHPALPLGVMPAPPGQWQGQEDSMRHWLLAKAEEDKRKQEEQKTQQETLRLEQRKIEQAMLRESLQAGIPPAMVPMIYAGMGGAHLASTSLDWLQQYASQLQMAQHQIQRVSSSSPSPEMQREQGRLTGAPPPPPLATYPQPTQQQVLPSQAVDYAAPAPGPRQTTFSAYQPAPMRQPPTSTPRSATLTQLPRLTTNEMYPQPQQGTTQHPLQHSQTIQQDQASSSPIYFHHWVPPSEPKAGTQPHTPASKGESHSAHPSSQPQESEYRESPRKRKAQGGHHANPPPPAGPQYTSPSFSTTSSNSGRKGGHARSRSNTSCGRDSDGRPDSGRQDDPSPSSKQQPQHQQAQQRQAAATDEPTPQPSQPLHPQPPPPPPRSQEEQSSGWSSSADAPKRERESHPESPPRTQPS